MLKKLILTSGLCLALAATACTGSSDGAASTSESESAESSGSNSSSDSTETESSTTTTQPDVPDEAGLPMANGVVIEQLTDKRGGGVRPTLAWSEIAGSESYTVVVYDAEGSPWWSWSGPGTEVVIGGVETDAEIGGPRADSGVRWIVMAFDVDGNMVGTSAKRSIEP